MKNNQERFDLLEAGYSRNEKGEIIHEATGDIVNETYQIVKEAPSEERRKWLEHYEKWLEIYKRKNEKDGGHQSEETVMNLAKRHTNAELRKEEEEELRRKREERKQKKNRNK